MVERAYEENPLRVTIEKVNDLEFLAIPELGRNIPIYDFRNLQHHEPIARALAGGARMAMFAGVWGAFKLVRRNIKEELFFHKEIKPGRPEEAKVPLMVRPIDGKQLIDWSKVHKDFRYLSEYREFKKLWESHPGFLHISAPVRHSLYSLPHIFITTPEDYIARYQRSDTIPFPTISVIYRADSYLEHLATWIMRCSHTLMYLGVSTLNPHRKEPPYTLEEVVEQISVGETPADAINLIVSDSIYEKYGALGSHTIARLPMVGERPTVKILREGSYSREGFQRSTGLECEVIPNAKDVKKVSGMNLDTKLLGMKAEITSTWAQQEQSIHFLR